MRKASIQSELYIASLNSPNPSISIDHGNGSKKSHLMLSTAEGIHIISMNEIIRAEASGNYCTLFCEKERKVLVSRTLKAVEELLPAFTFCRVHQSHCIRISDVRMLNKDSLILNDGCFSPSTTNPDGSIEKYYHQAIISKYK